MARKQKLFIAIFAGATVLLGVFRIYRTIGHADQIQRCMSNLQALGDRLLLFANSHQGHYPDRLGDLCTDQPDVSPELFVVPWVSRRAADGATPAERANQIAGHCSYVFLGAGRTVSDFGSEDVLAFTADGPSPTGKIYCLCGGGWVTANDDLFVIQAVISTLTRKQAVFPKEK